MGSSLGPTQIVTDGLVLHLDAGNKRSYPGSGTTWFDLSGNGNDGTLENGASVFQETVGVIKLDGANDRISVADNNNDFDFGTGNFSLNIWLKQGEDNTYPHLFALDTQYNFSLKAVRGGLETAYMLYVYQNYSVPFTNSYLTPNIWQMITLTRISQLHNLYINGILSDSVTDTSGPKNITGSTAYIGWGWSSEYTPQERGPIQIYNRALSAEEILQNYNATKERFTNK